MSNPKRASKTHEIKIVQDPSEPPRRSFSNGSNLELIVWYDSPSLQHIVGFQIAYKENPFNTDNEFFLTKRPHSAGASKVESGQIMPSSPQFPSPKVIQKASGGPPPEMQNSIHEMLSDLPDDVQEYLRRHLDFIS